MSSNSSDRLRRIAAAHVLALEDPEASEERILVALAWLEENEEHYLLAREVSRFSLICDQWPDGISLRPSKVTRCRWSWLRRPTNWAIAATAALVTLGLVVFAFQIGLLIHRPASSSFEYFTDIGERKSVVLPDRTRVELGAASGIRVTYGDAFRRITLTSGEAFFDVRKDKERPLIVATEDGEVTALGTAFNVHRSPSATTVTLLRGLVRVATTQRDDGRVAFLRPNTQVEIRHGGALSEVRSVDGSATLSWREGTYRYEGAALATIVSDLRRYYRKPILLDSPALNEMRFTGVVNLTSSDIEQWLIGLQSLDDIQITILDDAVIVSQGSPRASK